MRSKHGLEKEAPIILEKEAPIIWKWRHHFLKAFCNIWLVENTVGPLTTNCTQIDRDSTITVSRVS